MDSIRGRRSEPTQRRQRPLTLSRGSKRYDVLASREDDKVAEEEALAPEIENQGVEPMIVSVPAEPSTIYIPNTSKHALLRILKKNQLVLPSEPQLLGLKQRERSDLFSCIQPSVSQTRFLVESPLQNEHSFRSVDEITHLLRL
uniref:Uncharacterized protein n=1 Tax=Peronospora matthiolae TaxID=2874970 RepID=A0AAV1TE22_9STRA